jgi:hypothetical protein
MRTNKVTTSYEIIARETETKAIKIITLDNIAFNNWMIGNDCCDDYEVLRVKKIG